MVNSSSIDRKLSIGVLALQGDFSKHIEKIVSCGALCQEIRNPQQLAELDALIIPGGESSAFLKLLDEPLKAALIEFVETEKPVLATCAGLILLAKEVENPKQESLGVLDIAVSRNAYGRQVDSFIDNLKWEDKALELINSLDLNSEPSIEGVFIRAPQISRVDSNVEVLISRKGSPVMIKQGNILGACFHPELCSSSKLIHELLVRLIVPALS